MDESSSDVWHNFNFGSYFLYKPKKKNLNKSIYLTKFSYKYTYVKFLYFAFK